MKPQGIPIGIENQLDKALQRQMILTEENTIKMVLKAHLGRDATIDDAKLCSQILSDPWDGTYRLLYNRVELGTIRYIHTHDKFRVEFEPIQKMN